jgi:hypothetical protein
METEELQQLAQALSQRINKKVRLDQVANLLRVYELREVGCLVAEVTEQEMLGSLDPVTCLDPVAFLAQAVAEEVPMPEMVLVPREALIVPAPQVGADGAHESGRTLYLPTEAGPTPLQTFCSSKTRDLRTARNELARLLRGIREKHAKLYRNAPQVTLVAMSEPRAHQDPITHEAQAWVDGVALSGQWFWSDDRGKMVRMG